MAATLAGLCLWAVAPGRAGEVAPLLVGGWSTEVVIDGGGAREDEGRLGRLRAQLTNDDPQAVLEAIRFTLDEVGDGATYVWHRMQGPLWGTVRPTMTFRDAKGEVCRHIVLALSLETYSKRIEGVACRDAGRRWRLEG